jgi:hypothetical protein
MTVHIIKRGGRGMPIVEDDNDRYRFIKALYFLNDVNHPLRWERDVDALGSGLHFQRPDNWPGEREQYVRILSYCLQDNHHHLLLEEVQEGGVANFMKSLSASMTQAYNEKYDTEGTIFQGRPKKKIVETDEYLRLLYVYINVKNPFERYESGLEEAISNFEDVFTAALNYPFSSLPDIMKKRKSPVTATDMFDELFSSPDAFKNFAKEQMQQYEVFLQDVNTSQLE